MTELRKVTQLAWRKFLLSDAGMEGMLYLREHIPSIQPSDADSIIFQAGTTQGFKNGIDTISEIIAAEPVKEQKLENE